jgi:hypothetical protein
MPNPKQANHFHMKYAKESLEAYRADFVRASGAKGTTDVAGEATATYSMCAQVPPRAACRSPTCTGCSPPRPTCPGCNRM